jgi:molecular chaperone GrpE
MTETDSKPESPPAEEPRTVAAARDAELEAAKAQAAEYLDGWRRAQAELQNFRKRTEREQAEAMARTTGRVLARLFPVLDDFERALREPRSPEALGRWTEGVELIYQKCLGLLREEGVELIQARGQAFDPALHEALSYESSRDHREGEIIDVVHPGYRLGETVLRPALVRVARAALSEDNPAEASGA